MCGIVGARDDWLRRSGLPPERAMRDAVAELAWRGPDGQQLTRCGSWWLGCARLAISRADSGQPVVRRGERFAAVMNGAVTNARELWAEWQPGIERRAALPNDAWLPLVGVEHGGQLEQMRGHHAFAVVDAERDEVVIGRDRFGEKPLLYLFERGQFLQPRPAQRRLTAQFAQQKRQFRRRQLPHLAGSQAQPDTRLQQPLPIKTAHSGNAKARARSWPASRAAATGPPSISTVSKSRKSPCQPPPRNPATITANTSRVENAPASNRSTMATRLSASIEASNSARAPSVKRITWRSPSNRTATSPSQGFAIRAP